MTHHAQAVHLIATNAIPTSFDGKRWLLAINMWGMIAGAYIAAAMMIAEGWQIWCCRKFDRWNHPITAQRVTVVLASMAAFIRCAGAALSLLGWDPRDPTTGAVILGLQRYFDPLAVMCLFGWLTMRILTREAVNHQLRRQPLPINLWATAPQLVKPASVIFLASVMAFGVVFFRGN
jgi:hypothetical protein